ncbi:MAG: hypothetical protein ACI93L_003215, partial [Cyclobacteriaceae bacterium]
STQNTDHNYYSFNKIINAIFGENFKDTFPVFCIKK